MGGCGKRIKVNLDYITGEKKKEDRKEGKEKRKEGRKEKNVGRRNNKREK